MQINKVGMTRNHFQPGNASRIRMIVMHATAGRFPGDYNWLRNGGGRTSNTWVSIHYYIDKRGTISQMVDDHNIAWHAGTSTWVVDGRRIDYNVGCNPVSIGIELENLNNGRDPYPQAQYDAALWLVRKLVAQYTIPRSQLVRHLDIAPRRKTDPAGFPWERFKAQVYTTATPPPPTELRPPLEPLPPSHQLRKLLIDLAYRAAGAAYPAGGWPLLKEAVSRQTGMPIMVITAPENQHPAETPEGQSRGVAVAGPPPFIIEAYGRDLFYAPTANPDQIKRLSTTEPPLRDGLLQVLFLTADPAHGFRADWAFHQFYLQHMTEIGVPIGPNHRLPGATSDGRTFACQHFALDTLCSPTGQWSTIIRLSDLTRDMYGADPHQPWEKELRTLLLNDLYKARTGRVFDQAALFNRYAITRRLGAPVGKAELDALEGERFVAMPFALDVIYARIPPDGDWRNVVVGELPVLGGSGLPDDGVARLSQLLTQEEFTADATAPVLGTAPDQAGNGTKVLPDTVYAGGLLGVEADVPTIIDLTLSGEEGESRGHSTPDLVVVCPTAGPASADISRAAQIGDKAWHYYVSLTGEIFRLVDEQYIASATSDAMWQGRSDVGQRSFVVAVESGTTSLSESQFAALVWLLRDLIQRYNLAKEQIIQEADLQMSRVADWDALISQVG